MDSDLSEAASPRRLWGWAIFIAVAGIAARAVWYVRFKEDLPLRNGPDGDVYIGQAKAFLNGAIGNPAATGLATVYREAFAPGYALFVAGLWLPLPRGDVFRNADYVLLVVYAVQSLLVALTTLMTFALARRVLFGWSALAPPAIITLSIALVDLPNMFAYETLLAFLLTASVLLLVKAHNDALPPISERFWQEELPSARGQWICALLAGMTLSAAILVQPRVALLLPFATWWLVRATRGAIAALFLVVALILPAAWIARDYAKFNTFVPIAINAQESLYTDNIDPLGGSGYVPDAVPPQCSRDALFAQDLALHFAWARCMQRAGINAVADHPSDSALAVPDRIAAMFSPWDPQYARGAYSSDKWGYQRLVPASARANATVQRGLDVGAILLAAGYIVLVVIGIGALWLEGAGSIARMIAIPILTLPLAHLLFHAENRFRVPLLPLLAICLAVGFLTVLDALSPAKRHHEAVSEESPFNT